MSMSLGMGLAMQMRQVQRLEHRLSLQAYIPEEFQHFIKIENDKDLPLLKQSLPFLVLHEVSHPLFDEGYITVPELVPQGEFAGYVTEIGYQQALETGLDKAAMVIGQEVCRFPRAKIYSAHLAIVQRVYRDMVEQRKQPLDEGLLARLEAELQYHTPRAPEGWQEKIEELRGKINEAMRKELQPRSMFGIYEDMVRSYEVVYDKTLVREPERE